LYIHNSVTYVSSYSDGAAIVVKSPRVSSSFSRQLYNPQCFLQYVDPTIAPDEWNVSYGCTVCGYIGIARHQILIPVECVQPFPLCRGQS